MPLRSVSLIAFLVFAGFCCAQTSPTPSVATGETGVEGVIKLSPTRPGPIRVGEPDSGPLPNVTFVVSGGTNATTEFATDKEGHFRILLAPGHYTVSRKGQRGRIGHYGPFDVDVVSGQITKVEWHCDSGMR
jgi:hypothetical protein